MWLSRSERKKTWSSPGSTVVMHLGLRHLRTLTMRSGSVKWRFSTSTPSRITLCKCQQQAGRGAVGCGSCPIRLQQTDHAISYSHHRGGSSQELSHAPISEQCGNSLGKYVVAQEALYHETGQEKETLNL